MPEKVADLIFKHPVISIVLSLALLATGAGGTLLSQTSLGKDILHQAGMYTDKRVDDVVSQMQQGFAAQRCESKMMQRDAAAAQLFNVTESNNKESTESKRREIARLSQTLDDIRTELRKCL